MRILITTPWYPIGTSSLGVHIAEIARALRRAGHEIAVACIQQDTELAGVHAVESSHNDSDLGFPVVHVRYPAIRWRWRLPCLRSFFQTFRRIRAWFNPDVLHAHTILPTGLATLLVGKRYRLPVVVTEHIAPITAFLQSTVDRLMMRLVFQKADAVCAVSDPFRREIARHIPLRRRIDVVNPIVNASKFSIAERESEKDDGVTRVLFVSRGWAHQKGHDVLLRAFARTVREVSGRMVLVMVGPNLEQELGAMAASLGIADRCDFVGPVANTELARLMRGCSFLVSSSSNESFGLSIAEAMACGKPVVATRCGGPQEIVTPLNGLLVPVGDEGGLAQAMAWMARNLSQFNPGEIRRDVLERFGERAILDKMTHIYERVRSGHACSWN